MMPSDLWQEDYRDKKVLVTGHTGFKGAWLSLWLCELGARVTGFSLEDWANDRLFKLAGLSARLADERGDISDAKRLEEVVSKYRPEIVFHLAAQPLVRESYWDPVKTFRTNVMGTVHVLECMRKSEALRAGVIVTSDKCYRNQEREKGYRESDELGGHDPYSASKAGAELIVHSYDQSFFRGTGKMIASARAGNNLGGGDYAKDRLVPDSIAALAGGREIEIRNPDAVRPWQHVLEPLRGYLWLGAKLLNREEAFAQAWNFGPGQESVVPVSKVIELIIRYWGGGRWRSVESPRDWHESKLLQLDISKAVRELGWRPRWTIEQVIEKTVEWYKNVGAGDAYALCVRQIKEYMRA
jgi:CDP-glucose 4,6-dehydratase